jgi:hypothetical protein
VSKIIRLGCIKPTIVQEYTNPEASTFDLYAPLINNLKKKYLRFDSEEKNFLMAYNRYQKVPLLSRCFLKKPKRV